jgi:hypothetical protein
MAGGLTQAMQQQALDNVFPTSAATDFIAYSTNGTTEAAILARTAIGATGWAAATAATPSVKANNAALTSAAASGAGTITHFAIYSASTAGTQKLDWTALTTSRTVAINDQITWAIGTCSVTLD